MSFFISSAIAADAPAAAAQQPGIEGMLFPLAILLFFYILFLRPQSKRAKEQKEMLATLGKGTEVVTTGGVLGKVAELDENFVCLEVGEGMFIQVQRHAITSIMPKGTYKGLAKKSKVGA